MNEQLEQKVARALCSRDATVNPKLHDKVWHLYIEDARAALKAHAEWLAEPDARKRLEKVVKPWMDDIDIVDAFLAEWQAMISAAHQQEE